MTKRVVTRGNTVFFSFVFYDENDAVAICNSAELQLTYPGEFDFVTETLTLTNDSNTWSAEWPSKAARPGWVEYHAHALAAGFEFSEDGRHRLTGNRANLDHDAFPTTTRDYSTA